MAARCVAHGLATAADGRCALCRREGTRSGPAPRPNWLALGALVLTVSATAGASYWVFAATESPAARDAAVLVPERPTSVPEPIEPAPTERPHEPLVDTPPAPAPTPALAVAEPSASAEPTPTTAPIDTEKARQDLKRALDDVQITMYSTSWCPVCAKARAWLAANNVRYEDHDVERDASAELKYRLLNPRGGVPTIDVDGDVLVGFSDDSMGRALARAAQRRLQRRGR